MNGHARGPEGGEVIGDLVDQSAEHCEVQGEIGDLESCRQRPRVHHARRILVAAEEQPALLMADVHAGLDEPHDGLKRLHTGDGLGNEELMPHGDEGHAEPGLRGHARRQGARRVHHHGGADLAAVGRHAGDPAALGKEPGHAREGQGARPQLGRARGEGDAQAGGVEPAVIGYVEDGARGARAEVRGEPLGLGGGDERQRAVMPSAWAVASPSRTRASPASV